MASSAIRTRIERIDSRLNDAEKRYRRAYEEELELENRYDVNFGLIGGTVALLTTINNVSYYANIRDSTNCGLGSYFVTVLIGSSFVLVVPAVWITLSRNARIKVWVSILQVHKRSLDVPSQLIVDSYDDLASSLISDEADNETREVGWFASAIGWLKSVFGYGIDDMEQGVLYSADFSLMVQNSMRMEERNNMPWEDLLGNKKAIVDLESKVNNMRALIGTNVLIVSYAKRYAQHIMLSVVAISFYLFGIPGLLLALYCR